MPPIPANKPTQLPNGSWTYTLPNGVTQTGTQDSINNLYNQSLQGADQYLLGNAGTPQTAPPAPMSGPPQPNPNPGQNSTPGAAPTDMSASAQAPNTQGGPPITGMATNAQGQDVSALQNYLVQQGYMTAAQVATGPGVYGPQTTAAVAKMDQALGIQPPPSGAPPSNLASKYNSAFSAVSGTAAPNTQAQASAAINASTQTSTDPVFNAMASSIQPIMDSLNQVLANLNNPALTAVSLQQEYNQIAQQYNLPGMQADLLNMQNVMTGTEQDIRDEVTKSGGFATESQVLGLSAARNKVILKQYNSLATQYQAAQTNVSNMMQYATSDQATQLQRTQISSGIAESMASIESQMQSMAITMNQNSLANYQKTLGTLGGDYNAFASTIPPNMQPYVENMMGLAPGTLSDPQELQILTNASYKQIQLQIAAQRAAVYGYNAGYPVNINTPLDANGVPVGASGAAGTPMTSVSPFSQSNPVNNTQSQTSYTVQPGDGLRAIATKYGITSDAGLQAIAKLNNLKNINTISAGQTLQIPIAVKDNSTGQTGYISADNYDPSKYTSLGSSPVIASQTAIDKAYNAMQSQVKTAQATPITGSPLNKGRLTRNANSALKNYLASPVYTAVSSGATYLARINAAMADPGSISDTSLADSIIKIETGGGQVTEAQLNTYFAGQSFADQFNVVGDKITAKGGVLSPSQRQDLAGLAKGVFDNYQQQYENLYVQAMQNLQGQGIPLNYGGNLPDFLSLIQTAPSTQ